MNVAMRKSRGKGGGRGISLVEVLIVLTIVTVLVGIVIPVLSIARRRADSSVEIHNLHQLGLAYAIYGDNFGMRARGTHDLVQMRLVPRSIVMSPHDLHRDGMANYLLDLLGKGDAGYLNLKLDYKFSYIGFRELKYPESEFDQHVAQNPSGGWLVSLVESDRKPAYSAGQFDGTYHRLLLDTAVVTRRHTEVEILDPTSSGRSIRTCSPLFWYIDASDEWKRHYIETR